MKKNLAVVVAWACAAGFAIGQPVVDKKPSGNKADPTSALHALPELDGALRSLLQREGIEVRAPMASSPIEPDAAAIKELESRSSQLGKSATVPQTQAVGLMLRFGEPAIQALAEAGQPPSAETIASIGAASSVPLQYQRAMSGRLYLWRFEQPIDLQQAESVAEALRRLPGVELVELDLVVQTQATSYDPYYGDQWNMRGILAGGINVEPAWSLTTGSSRVVVAVVDSGVLPNPEFSSRLLPGYDFVSDPLNSNDGDGRDADATDPGNWSPAGGCGPGSAAQSSSWHGTHVAGIIAADGANGWGIAGVSWRSTILPVRVVGRCGGLMSDIIDGIQWAVGLPVPGIPNNPNPAQIVNLSLGGYSPSGCNVSLQETINRAIGQGALLVVAAGNSSQNAALFTPANCRAVLTVVSVDPWGDLASYSNYDFSGDISAPGGDMIYGRLYGILSTVDAGTRSWGVPAYAYLQGTSMAAPHVSGAAALALAMNPALSGGELYYLLKLSSASFPSASLYCSLIKICGAGIVDASVSTLIAGALSSFKLVYEFYNVDLNHYFRTGAKGEAGLINKGSAGPGWYDTGDYFYAWSDASTGAVPVCRFYGTPGIGPNSHFYTASAAECEWLKNTDPGWTYEGIAFYAKLPVNGACPSNTVPIYRAYNMRWMHNDSNHRYTPRKSEYDKLVAKGWAGEGVTLCGVVAISQ
ncbi:MAG: S8 family peptidase [Burkholderiales bacterium]|nr:S8 family peptidase [Burkholderiales bacterium]